MVLGLPSAFSSRFFGDRICITMCVHHEAYLCLQHNYQDPDPVTSKKVGKTLQLVISELSQLVTGFSCCYENELRPWCNMDPPPAFGQLGPAFKRVHTSLHKFSKVGWSLILRVDA